MAISQVGSNVDFAITNTASNGTVSSTITVPAGTELVLVGVSGFTGGIGLTTLTFTKGGSDSLMTRLAPGTDTSSNWQCALFALALPDVGTNKALKWAWAAGPIPDGRLVFSVTFWAGINTASPVRDSKGVQGLFSTPKLTPQVSFASGDLVAAFCGFFYSAGDGAGAITSWYNLTQLANTTNNGPAEGAWATLATAGLVWSIYTPISSSGAAPDEPNYSWRNVLPLTGTAAEVRVTLKSGTDLGLRVDHCSVGIRSGTTGAVTTTVPAELKFSGASGFYLPSANQTITSDWTALPAALTASDRLVVIVDTGATPAKPAFWLDTAPGTEFFFRSAWASWDSTSDAGFSSATLQSSIALVEARVGSGSGTISVGVLTATGSEGAVAAVSLIPAAAPAGSGGGWSRLGIDLSVGV
jgi:hypothetical protein